MHISVLREEIIEYLDPKPNENFIDCTINGGGHSLAILEKTKPEGKILGIDWDKKVILNLEEKSASLKLQNRLILECDNFANLKKIVEGKDFEKVHGILFDLGLSSWHLEESGGGFSFRKNEPLNMRFSGNDRDNNNSTADEILNNYPEYEIEKILRNYGEEKFSQKIARGVTIARKSRPIQTTFQLVEIIQKSVPGWYQRQRLHFATRTFQALRIAVNDELKNLEAVLPQALKILLPSGKIAIISFHSLEDRIVKNFFKENAKENKLKVITKKPIHPSEYEVKENPRSRSAILRVVKKNV